MSLLWRPPSVVFSVLWLNIFCDVNLGQAPFFVFMFNSVKLVLFVLYNILSHSQNSVWTCFTEVLPLCFFLWLSFWIWFFDFCMFSVFFLFSLVIFHISIPQLSATMPTSPSQQQTLLNNNFCILLTTYHKLWPVCIR